MEHNKEPRSIATVSAELAFRGLLATTVLSYVVPTDVHEDPSHAYVMDTETGFTNYGYRETFVDLGSILMDKADIKPKVCLPIDTNHRTEYSLNKSTKPRVEHLESQDKHLEGLEKIIWPDLPDLSFVRLSSGSLENITNAQSIEEVNKAIRPLFTALGLELIVNTHAHTLSDGHYTAKPLSEEELPQIINAIKVLAKAVSETPAEYIAVSHIKKIIIGNKLEPVGAESDEWLITGLHANDDGGWIYVAIDTDAEQPIMKTWQHELFHAFDKSACPGYQTELHDDDFVALNPSGFTYTSDKNMSAHAASNVVASDYGAKRALEDKAEIAKNFATGTLVSTDETFKDSPLAKKERALLSRIEQRVPGYTEYVATLGERRVLLQAN